MNPLIILSGVLAIALAVVSYLHISYRACIKKVCRQLDFVRDNLTNMSIRSELPYAELEELAHSINEVFASIKQTRVDLHRSSKELREKVSSLSHDIRTPLTSLDGYFQILTTTDSEEERKRIQSIISGRIASLRDILEEMFRYAKLQDEDFHLELETVDVAGCIAESVIGFYDEFAQRGLTPIIAFDEDSFEMLSNRQGVRRLVQNIVKNALDHGENEVCLEMYIREDKLRFSCSNDVASPSEIHIEEVFSRFYKADSARSKTSTGLGLSIAKSLADHLGIGIEAKLEGGRFVIELLFQK